MKGLPKTKKTIVLRTDFSDGATWTWLCAEIQQPSIPDGYKALVECVSDREYESLDVAKAIALGRRGSDRPLIFIIDDIALSHPEHPVLVADLLREPGRTFRVIPSQVWAVENNLTICNMEFCEFADHADNDGIFRGFPEGS